MQAQLRVRLQREEEQRADPTPAPALSLSPARMDGPYPYPYPAGGEGERGALDPLDPLRLDLVRRVRQWDAKKGVLVQVRLLVLARCTGLG